MWRRSSVGDLFDVFRNFDDMFRTTFVDFFPAGCDTTRLLLPSGKTPAKSLARRGFFPAVESFQKNGTLFVKAELPGVEPSDLEVTLTGDRLTISGEKKHSSEKEEKDFYVREVSHGRFERTFRIPEGVASEDVKASFQNGVLDITSGKLSPGIAQDFLHIQASCSCNCFARSLVARASISWSRSPSMIRGRLCKLRLIRWSETLSWGKL